MWNDLSMIKVHIVKLSLSPSAKHWCSNNSPNQSNGCWWAQITSLVLGLWIFHTWLVFTPSIFSLDSFVLCFDGYQHSLHLRSPRSTTADTAFLSEVGLLWNKKLLLATGTCISLCHIPQAKIKVHLQLTKVKNCLMPRLFICSSSFLAWLGSSFHLRIFLMFPLQICLLISNLIHHSHDSFKCSHLNGNRHDW